MPAAIVSWMLLAPKVVKFVDAIPKTATGKDQRLRFAPLFEGYYETQFRPTEAWRA